jgi:cohesin loading factor subunit SCC2
MLLQFQVMTEKHVTIGNDVHVFNHISLGHLTEIFEYEALLQPMYSLIRDKRKTRNDFLSSVVKLFDIDLSESMDKDIYFFRFIAHNLVGMRYRVIEELLCIIFAINKVLSTTAMNLMSTLSLDIETDGLDLEITSKSNRSRRFKRRNELRLASEGVHELDGGLAMKLCLIMSILLLTKHVLKQTYSLTEE